MHRLAYAAMLLIIMAPAGLAQTGARFDDPLKVTREDEPADPAIMLRYSRTFQACQHRAVVTRAIAQCFTDEFARQDRVLNQAWKITFAQITGSDHSRLLMAQRAWLTGRDPFCRAHADTAAGGTIIPIIYADCRVELTIRRTLWLKHLR